MPLSLFNPLNETATANLAGRETGRLELNAGVGVNSPAAGIFQAAQIKQQYADLASKEQIQQMQGQNTLANTALQNQGSLATQQSQNTGLFNRTQMEVGQKTAEAKMVNDLGQATLANTASNQQAQQGVAQQQADTASLAQQQTGSFQQAQITDAQQKNHIESLKNTYMAMRQMKQDDIHAAGGVGAAIVGNHMMQNNGQPLAPADLDKADRTTLDYAVKTHVFNQEQADKFMQMPPMQRMIAASAFTQVAQAANAGNRAASGGSSVVIGGTDSSGNPVMNQPLTEANKTANQADQMNQEKSAAIMSTIGPQLDKDIGTWKSMAQSYVGGVESHLGISGGKADIYESRHTAETQIDLNFDAYQLAAVQSLGKAARAKPAADALNALTRKPNDDPATLAMKIKQINKMITSNTEYDKHAATYGTQVAGVNAGGGSPNPGVQQ